MARWVRLQLGRGTYEGRKIFGADRSREMWSPNTVVGGNPARLLGEVMPQAEFETGKLPPHLTYDPFRD